MREISFDVRGARLFAVEDGGGPPIVMVHGGMANHLAARPLVASLASRYRVITPDLRASGRSFYGGTLTFDQLADDLALRRALARSSCVARFNAGCRGGDRCLL